MVIWVFKDTCRLC